MAGDSQGGSSMKRKPSEPTDPADRAASKASKRPKLAEHGKENSGGFDSEGSRNLAHHLPAEIWHRIFTLLPPKTLGRLLTVNKLFRAYLDPSSTAEVKAPSTSPPILSPMKPDAIWQASRRTFWPHMPGPLKNASEVDMWRLCCSRTCQFCNYHDRSAHGKLQDQWTRGPGAKGVSPIFPFLIVSCGKCLSKNIVKEVDVYLSPSTPSFLLAGLPMVLVTPEPHVIAPQVLSSGTGSLQHQVAKAFYSTQLKNITAEFEAVKTLGYAAAEEWTKGLEVRGKRLVADVSRWERWYLSGGVHDMRTSQQSLQTPYLKDAAASHEQFRDKIEAVRTAEKIGGKGFLPDRAHGSENDSTAGRGEASTTHPRSRTRPLGQQKLTEEEARELRAKRKAEIEHRASLLEPPMTPAVLAHAPSFQAAVQIATPLDDKAWEILKPRLLDHREAAERQERGINMDALAVAKAAQPSNLTSQPRKEVTDEDWDEAQGPLRAKIAGFADEIIRGTWNNGENLRKKDASEFAVGVLHFVRSCFYADILEEDREAQAAGKRPITEPPEGPWTRKLTLENLKWIFDTKIKPHTDRHRKELFYCNACDVSRKAYGLESAIQHYAAKHTTALSAGNIVVHWRAEWPDFTMFSADQKPKQPRQPLKNVHTPSVQPPPSSGFNNFVANDVPLFVAHPPTEYSGAYPPQQYPTYAPVHPLHSQWSQHAGRNQPRQQDTGHESVVPASTTFDQGTNRLTFMTEFAEKIWTKMSHVKGLPDAAKALAFIHHFTKRFEKQFGETAPLDFFFAALSSRNVIDSARSLKGLRCKSCESDDENSSKGKTFHALVQHYMAKHNGQLGGGHHQDWRQNILRSPDMSSLPKLRKDSRTHKESLAFVAEALPGMIEPKPSSSLTAEKHQQARVEEPSQEKLEASDSGYMRDSSSSDSYEPQLNPEDTIAKVESLEPRGVPNAIPVANVSDGLRKAAALDAVDRPVLKPASLVYGRPDTPPRARKGQASSQRGGRRTQKAALPDAGLEDGEARWAPARTNPARPDDGGFEMLEHQADSHRGAPARYRTAAQGINRDLLPHEYPSRDQAPRMGYAVAPEYPADRYHGPAPHVLARPEPVGWYDGRSPRMAYPPAPYRQGEELVAYRGHPDDLSARHARAPEAYELVEVRDPRGDYFIKLPIRRDPGAFYPYETRGVDPFYRHEPAYPHEPQARQATVYEDFRQTAAYEDYRQRPPANPPQRPPSPMDYQEYDPRYPAPGGDNAAPPPRDR